MAWCGYCGGGGTGCIVIYRHWDSNGCQDGISCAVSLVFGLFRNLLPAATSVLSSAAFLYGRLPVVRPPVLPSVRVAHGLAQPDNKRVVIDVCIGLSGREWTKPLNLFCLFTGYTVPLAVTEHDLKRVNNRSAAPPLRYVFPHHQHFHTSTSTPATANTSPGRRGYITGTRPPDTRTCSVPLSVAWYSHPFV